MFSPVRTLSAAAALVVFSGAALAAGPQPAAGEAPFAHEVVVQSVAARAEVRAEAIAQPPAAGTLSASAAEPAKPSLFSRAEVRAQTRDAIAHGFHPAAGEQS